MCDDIMLSVVGVTCTSRPGTLSGYQRLCVRGEDYPALVPFSGGSVVGVVYYDILPTAWDRLDRFEGDMYARCCVHIDLGQMEQLSADTYVVKPDYTDLLESRPWQFDRFLQQGKQRFIEAYGGYEYL